MNRDLKYPIAPAPTTAISAGRDASFVSQPTLSTQIELETNWAWRWSNARRADDTDAGRARGGPNCWRIVAEVQQLGSRAATSRAGSDAPGPVPTLPAARGAAHPQAFPQQLELLLVERTDDAAAAPARRHARCHCSRCRCTTTSCAEFLFWSQVCWPVPQIIHFSFRTDHRAGRPFRADLPRCSERTGIACATRRWTVTATPAPGTENLPRQSRETLRQMVAANVDVTLLPSLAVKPPVALVRRDPAAAVPRPAAEPAHRDGVAQFGDVRLPPATRRRVQAPAAGTARGRCA